MFRRIRARFKGTTFKSWLGIAGLWGAGLLLPCPDCGGRMLLHFWPLALVFTLLNLQRRKRTVQNTGPVNNTRPAENAEMTNDPDAHRTDSV
jgi:hypothetical protein